MGGRCKKNPDGNQHQFKAHQWEHKDAEGTKVVSVLYCHWCGEMPKKPPKGWKRK